MPAGGSGQIEITLSTGKKAKKLKKTITVISNDPSAKKLFLTVTANVSEEVEPVKEIDEIEEKIKKDNKKKSLFK
ncbi:MAG: hypothetical protein GY754_38555 [bacterium]|nr:hypothetical protein [bacterium]